MKLLSGKSVLALAVSLFSCGAVYAIPGGQLSGTTESPQAVGRDGGAGITSSLEELCNDDGSPYYVFTNKWYSAARLQPYGHCRLETLRFAIFVPAESTWVSQTLDLLIYNNDPDYNDPGTLRFDGYVDLPYLEPGYWGWFEVDISPYDLHFSDDFWVCYHKSVYSAPLMLGDGSEAPPNWNMYASSPQGPWTSWTLGDFMTRAIVEYYNPADWYDWPLLLMSYQHSVRSVLNEYRNGAAPHFHDGIDIDAQQGTAVFAVREGTAYEGGFGSGTYVRVIGQAEHWYIHLDEPIGYGVYVDIGDSLGVTNELNHVHLGDGPDQNEINPLRAPDQNGVEPFDDYLSPTVDQIVFVLNGDYENPLDPLALPFDKLDIIADARDAISGGGNNAGIWKIGYQIDWDPPIFNFQFDSWIPSSHIDWVYAPGSQTTGPFRYVVTNYVGSDGWWDATNLSPGWYTVCVIAQDVWVGNADTRCVDVHFTSGAVEDAPELREDLSGADLIANYPNPFNATLNIRYAVRETGRVRVGMCNVSGRKVRMLTAGWQKPGMYFTQWDGKDDSGTDVASGVYFCWLEAGKHTATARAVLVR